MSDMIAHRMTKRQAERYERGRVGERAQHLLGEVPQSLKVGRS